MDRLQEAFDVVIAGGGPGGSTLAALLAQWTDLRIALFEQERFPRDRIGESFSHRIVPVLEESGVLDKVMSSGCAIRKYGGYYAWNPDAPSVSLFEHSQSLRDGIVRWAMHVNRAEFDGILLDHAREAGVLVQEGVGVAKVSRHVGGNEITLTDGRTVGARVFVDASGRAGGLGVGGEKAFLSDYKNIAIWTHVQGGIPAHTLPGDWNIFRDRDWSSIGSYAFEDGWFWYIPVPKTIGNKRVRTHSLGLVTDPQALKKHDYTDPAVFMETVRRVPLLRDLVRDATPISSRLQRATNYSRISRRYCDYDGRWILIGDAAGFVDPLFSTGVAFAVNHAHTVAQLLVAHFDADLDDDAKRSLWDDYHDTWYDFARTFALGIDQWYLAIARHHPSSEHWQSRAASAIDDESWRRSFHSLVDATVTPDLLRMLTEGSGRPEDLGDQGALARYYAELPRVDADDGASLRIHPDVRLTRSWTLGAGGTKPVRPVGETFPSDDDIRAYWEDPMANAHRVPAMRGAPRGCHRVSFEGQPDAPSLKLIDATHGELGLIQRLSEVSADYAALEPTLSDPQRALLTRLLRAGMVTVSYPG